MADTNELPIEQLLAPIPGDAPAGKNLRADDSIDPALRTARDLAKDAIKKERDAGNAGDDPSFAGISEWRSASEECQTILRDLSKDIEVGAIIVEASVRTDGLAGLAGGLELVAGLAEQYWPDILERAKAAVAEPNEEEIIQTLLIRPNQWSEALFLPIARVPLTSGGSEGDYAYWQYEQAVQAEKLSPEEREKRKAISVDQFSRAVISTATSRPAEILALLANLDRAKTAAERVETAFQDRLEGALSVHAPSLGKIKERLEDIKRCLHHSGKEVLEALLAAGSAPAGAAGGGAVAAGGGGGLGELTNRDQAFRELSRIADFFARTEPLSLLAEQIRQVVRRGRLSPDKYYKDLIDDENTLRQFFRIVGVTPTDEESS
jgi:type VI secretion system protein ImpA